MKIYRVKVNGKVFEVELEAVSEVNGNVTPAAKEEVKPAVSNNANGAKVLAPIAGKLMSINVKVGDKITKNQTVAIIEAMKLENEVPSPCEGVVKEIIVKEGSSVNNGDVLIVLG